MRWTMQSVILAGIYDINNLKLKVRLDLEHQYNSPWNIAADFNVDMSFSISDIGGMLEEYEGDFHTNMDIKAIAEMIYEYTDGYPFINLGIMFGFLKNNTVAVANRIFETKLYNSFLSDE